MSYQVVQSLFAVGTGGVWGTGFAEGHPNLIPEVHTDFVFAAIAEELGLVGAAFVLVNFALLFWRGSRIAMGLSRPQESARGGLRCESPPADVHHHGGRDEAPAAHGHYAAVH